MSAVAAADLCCPSVYTAMKLKNIYKREERRRRRCRIKK
jgi:hypothetical protein